MKRVWKQLARRRADVVRHPFFTWMRSDSVPLEKRFVFAPLMIDFIMGFADMNKWFLSYPQPRNALERSINDHTMEDRTHSRLFHHNWYTMDVGSSSGFAPGKVLWWLFQSSDSAVVRRFGMEILDMATTHTDPLVRFPMMEAIEICGDVFFGHTAPVAEQMSAQTGLPHHYFGEYHRARETGHLHGDESVFLRASLTEAQARDCEISVARIFDTFLEMLDKLLSYSERCLADPAGFDADLESEYRSTTTLAAGARADGGARHRSILGHLARRKQQLRRHPLLAWLRDDDGTREADKLRRFVALWGVDIAGYQDFNQLVLRYANPSNEAEQAINRWTEDLATHASLYLEDWRALDMDRVLEWDMGQTIAFYFLGEQTEVHRANMAKIKKYAFGHKKSAIRFWLMKALEASGEPLFENTAPLAEAVEADFGVTLNYWANRHRLAHSAPNVVPTYGDPSAYEELSGADRALVIEIIDVIFDNMEEQYSLSYHEAEKSRFVQDPASLPPTRVSQIVRRAEASAVFHESEDGHQLEERVAS